MSLFRRDIFPYQIRDALLYWLLIPAAIYGIGKTADFVFRLPGLAEPAGLNYAAALIILAGLFCIYQAIHDLQHHGRGTPNPRRPPKVLVRLGIYRWSRHPMFLGYDLIAIGAALLTRSLGMLLIGLPVLFLLQTIFLRREERALARRFKKEFSEYRNKTPFLIPCHFLHRRKP
mgnify:CR=1 FL=1